MSAGATPAPAGLSRQPRGTAGRGDSGGLLTLQQTDDLHLGRVTPQTDPAGDGL